MTTQLANAGAPRSLPKKPRNPPHERKKKPPVRAAIETGSGWAAVPKS
nr:MAG TPA: hypothetical protein [Caudoviricetes sp.]